MSLLELHDVERVYKLGDIEVAALAGVSLSIEKGEFVAIMGASGSGKSTLLNIIGCLDRPTSGTYLIDGKDMSGLSRDERARVRGSTLGFVFQQFNLLARTGARENVELPLLYAGVSAKERHHKAMTALTRMGLADRADHHPSQLSGGQQQRVAIARAIVNDPKLILADEPTGALDSRTSLEVMAIFQELGAQGITIVLVTHEPDVARFASRLIVVRDGKIVQDERQEPVRPLEAHA